MRIGNGGEGMEEEEKKRSLARGYTDVSPKSVGSSSSKAVVKDKSTVTESSSPAKKKKINPKYYDAVRGPLYSLNSKSGATKVKSVQQRYALWQDAATLWMELLAGTRIRRHKRM